MDESSGSTPSPQNGPSGHLSDLDNPDLLVQQSATRLTAALATLPPSDNLKHREKFVEGLNWEVVSQLMNL